MLKYESCKKSENTEFGVQMPQFLEIVPNPNMVLSQCVIWYKGTLVTLVLVQGFFRRKKKYKGFKNLNDTLVDKVSRAIHLR